MSSELTNALEIVGGVILALGETTSTNKSEDDLPNIFTSADTPFSESLFGLRSKKVACVFIYGTANISRVNMSLTAFTRGVPDGLSDE
jgi:hypothetical protein